MGKTHTIGIVSDIHYAGAAERTRGSDYEYRALQRPVLRTLVRFHRHYLWMRDPLEKGYLLDRFLCAVGQVDCLVALGDYSCNSAFVGLSDSLAYQSAEECLGKLRGRFRENLVATLGDHELGKLSLVGGQGGMRLASWRACVELGIEPFWQRRFGKYVLLGVPSSLLALPLLEADALPDELTEWRRLRDEHLKLVRAAFAGLRGDDRVLLFCHDPSALPFLWQEEIVRAKAQRIEQTFIGHLHSNLILWQSRMLAGIPVIGFLGQTGRRLTSALRDARTWRHFRVRLCPALAGIQLLNDGGYWVVTLDEDASRPLNYELFPMPR